MKVGTKLFASYGVLVALLAVVSAVSAWRIGSINERVTEIIDDRYVKVSLATDIDQAVGVQARMLRNAIIAAKDPEEVRTSLEELNKAVAANTERMAKLSKIVTTPKGEQLMKAMADTRSRYGQPRDETVRLLKDGKADEAAAYLLKNVRGPQNEFLNAIEAMVALQTELMVQAGNDAKADGRAAIQTTLALAVLAMLGAAAMAVVITRGLLRQLGGEPEDVVKVANAIAEGDLGVSIQPAAGDTTSIVAAMQRMRDRLAHIVSQVRNCSESIATGSAQIATGNADLSQRTEEQASNLQQTAASMEQLSATVKTNADTTGEASALAAQAAEAAVKGGRTVGAVVATMQDIASSSKKIADIIGVIDGIAFQTNILALNAAVEAARAGEQGRGFAVVAGEVRNLASRSADAAKEIKTLIGASVDKVEAGARQVNEAGTSMDAIVAQVQRVTQLITDVSSATAEQSSGIGQVGNAMSQLDQVTQQNAALVEEGAAAAESLSQQAQQLTELVKVFRVPQGGDGRLAPVTPLATRPVAPRAPVASPVVRALPAPASAAASPAAAPASAGVDEWDTF